MPRLTLTTEQMNALLAVLHGAMDDDDHSDENYTRNLQEATGRLLEALRRDRRGRGV